MTDLILGLGSNIGWRERHLRLACRALSEAFGPVMRSNFVESAAVTLPRAARQWARRPFLNCVVLVESDAKPQEVLAIIQQIELGLGKSRRKRGMWAPRPIDIDILAYGDLLFRSDELTIPHPRMLQRNFVMQPLAEVLPDWKHPALSTTWVNRALVFAQPTGVKLPHRL